MSKSLALDNAKQLVMTVEGDFEKLARLHGAVNWEQEASYAVQALQDNDYLMSQATSNPSSLQRAVINVASIGLSLSPIEKLAYLVPRQKAVKLDISWRGLIKIATDDNVILWCRPELVYSEDDFTLNGVDEKPTHRYEPFAKSRGDLIGGYALTKLTDGTYSVYTMSIEDINELRDRSPSSKNGPWVTDYKAMAKKTIVRQAANHWPQAKTERLAKALNTMDDSSEVTLDVKPVNTEAASKLITDIHTALDILNKPIDGFITYCASVVKREIKGFEEMTEIELKQSLNFLNSLIDQKNAKSETPVEKKLKNHAPGASDA